MAKRMAQLRELFPNTPSIAIFSAYMFFCVGQGIFITASKKVGSSGYDYNTVSAVLMTEVVKLCLAVVCYLKDGNLKNLITDIKKDGRICAKYLVPSFLYCIYNNLAFINLAVFDPTTYFLLLQLRVVVTGIIFQIVFSRRLSGWQWFSLFLLTSGCMLQQLDWDQLTASSPTTTDSRSPIRFSFNILLILLQTACSCLAGVYNEYLLKGQAGQVNIFVQNIFMYVDSIFWNVLVLTGQGNLTSSLSLSSLETLIRPVVIILILNNALIGITTSLFLKNLNSILKTFASALELVFTAVLTFWLFGIPIKPNTWVAIVVVSYSIYLYSKHPVVNKTPPPASEPLLDKLKTNV